jgi:hypothetical protein
LNQSKKIATLVRWTGVAICFVAASRLLEHTLQFSYAAAYFIGLSL